MTIHKEGYSTILVSFIALAIINLGVYFLSSQSLIITLISLGLSFILWLVVVNFFRSPLRVCKIQDGTVIAPADGTVVVIEEVEEPECLKTKCKQVSIFMTPLNVHVNWFPMSGVVKFVKHHSGRFMGAYLPKSSTENERTTVLIEDKSGKQIVVRQVAGAMARRIVCYAENNTTVDQGAQMGFIKFGSRLDLYLPLDADIKVDLDEKVTGTQTIIAQL